VFRQAVAKISWIVWLYIFWAVYCNAIEMYAEINACPFENYRIFNLQCIVEVITFSNPSLYINICVELNGVIQCFH